MRPPASLWWSTMNEDVVPRPSLNAHADVDVAIVGGGFTGLWTARELLRRDPTLRVLVIEKSVCGFGASGRNGGWASALYPQSPTAVRDAYGAEAAAHLRRTLERAVEDLGAAAADDGIDADFVRGGTLVFARGEVQASRLRAEVDELRASGVTDVLWLDEAEARERGAATHVRGALFTPHCARLHPAKLVRGLARAVERAGATIVEETAVTRIVGGDAHRRATVVTTNGSVHARYVVRATEGYTPTLPGERRTVVPLYSLMIATEPLPHSFWDEVGLRNFETFADGRHLVIYGQRTADDRIAFGGRGAPYHFGSTVEARFDQSAKVFSLLETTLRELFPSLAGSITHRWGGPLAMPRDHEPAVRLDRDTGLASVGGYTGDGVVLSRVAASAMADLIVDPETETEFTRLPFVQHRSRPWEYEPLRWAGINAGLGAATWADHHERRHDTPSRASRWVERLMG